MLKQITFKIMGLFVLFAFKTNPSFTQNKYHSGYIIKNNGDTLFGLINYKHLDKIPDIIIFKLNSLDSSITYEPKDVNEFGLNNEVYTKGIIKSSIYDNKNDTIFLQTLYDGKKSLYYHKSPKGVESFFIKQGGKIEQLISKNYIPRKDGTIKIEKSKKYTEQLASYLSDCSFKRLNLKYASYNKNDLIYLFERYYKCAPSYNYYQTRKITTEFGVFIGTSLANIDFNGDGPFWGEGIDTYEKISQIQFGNSIRPSAGIFFNFILPYNHRKWSIINELMFSSYNLSGRYSNVVGMHYYNANCNLAYSYLKINNLVRFTQPIGPFSIFINGGISTGFTIIGKNTQNIDDHINGYVDYFKVDLLYDTRKKERGLILGSGIKYSKYSFEFRYELGDGMEANTNFKSTTKRYFALIGYTF